MTDKFDLSKYTKVQVQKPSELTMPQMIALVGKPGSGKTWLAASEALHYQKLNNGKKVLMIDTEGSATGTTVGLPDEFIDILPVSNPLELRKLIAGLIKEKHDYGTVIIDTFDSYHDDYIEYLKTVTKNSKGELNTLGAWGDLKVNQVALVNHLKKAPFRVILVVHNATEKRPDGTWYNGFALSGSAVNVIPGKPDMIGYTVRGLVGEGAKATVETIVNFTPSENSDAKNRFGLRALQNPTMDSIYEAITKKQGAK